MALQILSRVGLSVNVVGGISIPSSFTLLLTVNNIRESIPESVGFVVESISSAEIPVSCAMMRRIASITSVPSAGVGSVLCFSSMCHPLAGVALVLCFSSSWPVVEPTPVRVEGDPAGAIWVTISLRVGYSTNTDDGKSIPTSARSRLAMVSDIKESTPISPNWVSAFSSLMSTPATSEITVLKWLRYSSCAVAELDCLRAIPERSRGSAEAIVPFVRRVGAEGVSEGRKRSKTARGTR